MGKITQNFSEEEFACKCKVRGLFERDPFTYCGGLVVYDMNLVTKLQLLRNRINAQHKGGKEVPIIINSGYRCPAYNRRSRSSGQGVSGAMWSQHMLGKAADITVPHYTPEEVARFAKELGFSFIGVYDTFTHVDVRSGVDEPIIRDYREER